MQAAGYLEGYLSAERIFDHWYNVKWWLSQQTNDTFKIMDWWAARAAAAPRPGGCLLHALAPLSCCHAAPQQLGARAARLRCSAAEQRSAAAPPLVQAE